MKRLVLLILTCWTAAVAWADDPSAQPILKLLNSRVSGSPRQFAAAASEVAREARAGRPVQQYVLAVLADEEGFPPEARPTPAEREAFLKNARPRMEALAKTRDNALAWYLLYLEKRDPDLLDKAIAGGNVQALNAAGTTRLLQAISEPDEKIREEVMKTCFGWFRQAADQNDANAHNNLGLCYQNGYGCPKDEKTAFFWFSSAAKMGHSDAVNNLGRFHREGIVVPKDLVAALRCFKLGSDQGNVWAQINYALALIRGEGTPANAAFGIELLKSIAARGKPEAMDCLADCYDRGIGEVKADSWQSVLWTFRARAARGDANARKWLKENDETAHDR